MLDQRRKGSARNKFLVFIAIITLLVYLLVPAIKGMQELALRMKCQNHLKLIGFTLQNYHDVHGHYPQGCLGQNDKLPPEKRFSWYVEILPYVEQEKLAKQFEINSEYTGQSEKEQTYLQWFQCGVYNSDPKSENKHKTSYVAVSGLGLDAAKRPAGSQFNGFMGYERITTTSHIVDGTSNTICVVETCNADPWAQAGYSTLRGFDLDEEFDFANGKPFGGLHFNRGWFSKTYFLSNILLTDSSVRILLPNIDKEVLGSLITIADFDNKKDFFE